MKYQVIVNLNEEECTVITASGGIVCIRSAESINESSPRLSTTDYYQRKITDIPAEDISADASVYEHLAEGKMYYNDWRDTPYNSPSLINDALSWLGYDPQKCILSAKDLFPNITF